MIHLFKIFSFHIPINPFLKYDSIKLDVQGAELDIFRGGKNALSKTRFIYTEYSNIEIYEGQANLPELLKHLKNFKIIIRYQNDVLLKNTQFD